VAAGEPVPAAASTTNADAEPEARRAALVAWQAALRQLDALDDAGLTPLGAACAAGHVKAARMLLAGGGGASSNAHGHASFYDGGAVPRASPEARSARVYRGCVLLQRPLAIAACHGHVELVQLLLQHGAAASAPSDAAVPDRGAFRLDRTRDGDGDGDGDGAALARIRTPCDALGLAALAGHAHVVRALLAHPATLRAAEAERLVGSAAGPPATALAPGTLPGRTAESLGRAAAYTVRGGHADAAALLLPLTQRQPACFSWVRRVPGRELRVGPAAHAAPGPLQDAVVAALAAARDPLRPRGGADAAPSAALLPPLSPADVRWVLRHAHRTLLGYALVDDDAARLAGWMRHAAVRAAVDGHTLAQAIRVGAPRVTWALRHAHGLVFDAAAHVALVAVTGCDVRRLVGLGAPQQVAALAAAGAFRLSDAFLPATRHDAEPSTRGWSRRAAAALWRPIAGAASAAAALPPSPPWELTPAHLDRLRAAFATRHDVAAPAGARELAHPLSRQLGASVALPFGARGQGRGGETRGASTEPSGLMVGPEHFQGGGDTVQSGQGERKDTIAHGDGRDAGGSGWGCLARSRCRANRSLPELLTKQGRRLAAVSIDLIAGATRIGSQPRN
jgi:hypothetical protein